MSTLLSDEDALNIAAKEWLGYAPSPPFDAADPASDKLLRVARAVAAAQERATLERVLGCRTLGRACLDSCPACQLRNVLATEEPTDG